MNKSHVLCSGLSLVLLSLTFALTTLKAQDNPLPTLISVSPSSGQSGQTLTVTILGGGFRSGITAVDFGIGLTVNQISVLGNSLMTAAISIGSGASYGVRDVTVVNSLPGGGVAVLKDGFTVLPLINPIPSITSIEPTSANRLQTLSVIVRGTNFMPGVTSVNLGEGITVNSLAIDAAVRLTANITIDSAASLGKRDVYVFNALPGGGVAVLSGFAIGMNPPPTSVDMANGLPVESSLSQNYPNPFNPTTSIGYSVGATSSQRAAASRVRLVVYDLLGREVEVLVNERKEPGRYLVTWDATRFASGMYICRMMADGRMASMEMMLAK